MNFVHRYLRVYVSWKYHNPHILSIDQAPNNRAIEFTSPFSVGVNVEMNQLTLYDLNKEEYSWFLQGRKIQVTAGFYNSDGSAKNGGLITEGTIKSSTPLTLDGADRTIQVNFNHFPDISDKAIKTRKVVKVKIKNTRKKSGGKSSAGLIKSYNEKKSAELDRWLLNNPNATTHERGIKRCMIASERRSYAAKTRAQYAKTSKAKAAKAKYTKQVKYANLSFKKGTKASTIIKTIAKKAKIPLGPVKLEYDKKFSNTYTVTGKPLNAIKKVADSASTDVVIDGGKLSVREITTGEKARLVLTPESGLITHPTPTDDGKYQGNQFEAQSLMRKEIHVGALLYVNDGMRNYGKVVVLSGQREYTTSSSTVTFQFVLYSAYKKEKAKAIKKLKGKVKKSKKKAAAKDAKNKKKIQARRAARKK